MIKWFQANSLTLHFDKTKMLKFTPTITTNYQLNISFLDIILKIAESVTFLGLQMDNYLTHINHLLHKMSTLGFLMRKLSSLLSTNNLKSVYYAYFHSPVKYAIIYCGNTPECQKIFLIQKKVIRIMMGVGPTHSCCNLFKRLEILPIPCVYLLSLMIFVVNN
jgi:hypothetical protein